MFIRFLLAALWIAYAVAYAVANIFTYYFASVYAYAYLRCMHMIFLYVCWADGVISLRSFLRALFLMLFLITLGSAIFILLLGPYF